MSHISNVKIVQSKDGSLRHDVFVNGEPLKNVKSIQTFFDTDSIPSVDITLNSFSEFNGDALTSIWLETESINDCVAAVKFELFKNSKLADNLAEIIAGKIDGDMDKAREIVEEVTLEWEKW